jgi:tyrosine-protein phosphatase SIW14
MHHCTDSTLRRFSRVTMNIYRGSRPMSDEDCLFLRSVGIKTLLNLETMPQDVIPVKYFADKHGFQFIHEPILPIDPDLAPDRIINAIHVMLDPAAQPVYVHCLLGSDRTSLVVAMFRIHVQGWSMEDAYEEMLSFGFKPNFLFGLNEFFQKYKAQGSLEAV